MRLRRLRPPVHLDAMHSPAIPLDRRLGLVPLHTSDRYVGACAYCTAVYMARYYHRDVTATAALYCTTEIRIDMCNCFSRFHAVSVHPHLWPLCHNCYLCFLVAHLFGMSDSLIRSSSPASQGGSSVIPTSIGSPEVQSSSPTCSMPLSALTASA